MDDLTRLIGLDSTGVSGRVMESERAIGLTGEDLDLIGRLSHTTDRGRGGGRLRLELPSEVRMRRVNNEVRMSVGQKVSDTEMVRIEGAGGTRGSNEGGS
jgi:hypothetical protein